MEGPKGEVCIHITVSHKQAVSLHVSLHGHVGQDDFHLWKVQGNIVQGRGIPEFGSCLYERWSGVKQYWNSQLLDLFIDGVAAGIVVKDLNVLRNCLDPGMS